MAVPLGIGRRGMARGAQMPDERDTTLDHLPDQVRQQVEEARRAKEAIRQQQTSPQQAETPPESPDAPEKDTPQEKPVDTQPDAASAEWKRKHDALFGKYSSEIGQARGEIRDLKAEIERLKAAMATQAKPEKPTQDKPQGINLKDFDEYDDAFKRLAQTVARLEEENASLTTQLQTVTNGVQQQVASRLAPVEESVKRREYADFLGALQASVPHLDALNTDSDFLTWLTQPNPYDPNGGNFGDTLRAAESRRNVGAVAKIFNDFAAQSGKYKSESSTSPAASSRPKNVQPSASSASPNPTDKGPRVWSKVDIERFYTDLAQGKYRGRDDEVRAMKNEIFQAGVQGRIA